MIKSCKFVGDRVFGIVEGNMFMMWDYSRSAPLFEPIFPHQMDMSKYQVNIMDFIIIKNENDEDLVEANSSSSSTSKVKEEVI